MIARAPFDPLPPPAVDIVIQQNPEPWLLIVAAAGIVLVLAFAVRRRRNRVGKDDRA